MNNKVVKLYFKYKFLFSINPLDNNILMVQYLSLKFMLCLHIIVFMMSQSSYIDNSVLSVSTKQQLYVTRYLRNNVLFPDWLKIEGLCLFK